MYSLKVEKMSCGGCAARVTRTVHALDPQAKVEVSLKDGLVQIDSTEPATSVAAAIGAAGFPARPVEPA
jgi:copper chaperone